MDNFTSVIFVGVIIGLIDIIPMIVKKLPIYSIIASFLFFFFITIIIFYADLPYVPWWLQGSTISIALMLPILIHIFALDKKPIPIIVFNSLILGLLISIAKHFFI